LYFAIEEKLRAAGIEIPFPQRDVYIRSRNMQVASVPARDARRASDGAEA